MKAELEKRFMDAIEGLNDGQILCLVDMHVWKYYYQPHEGPLYADRAMRKCENCNKDEAV